MKLRSSRISERKASNKNKLKLQKEDNLSEKGRYSIVACFAIIIIVIPISIWFLFYRDTISISSVTYRNENNQNYLVFTIENTEDQSRCLKYSYEIADTTDRLVAYGSGEINMATHESRCITSQPNSKPINNCTFEMEHKIVRILISENGKRVGWWEGQLK